MSDEDEKDQKPVKLCLEEASSTPLPVQEKQFSNKYKRSGLGYSDA